MTGRTGPSERRRAIAYWGLVAVWMLVISGLSAEPFSARNTHRFIDPVLRFLFPDLTPSGFVLAHTVVRKTAHFVEFFVLGSLLFVALRRGRTPSWQLRWAGQALALGVGFALLDEAHQSFVRDRTASLADSGIDSLGVLCSQFVIALSHRIRPRRPQR